MTASNKILLPKLIPGKAQLIAMVHVHSSSALLNTSYADLFGIESYSAKDLVVLDDCRKQLLVLSKQLEAETGNTLFSVCRNASFVLKEQDIEGLEKNISKIPFVKLLINRALQEVQLFWQNGIRCIEVENVGAPYFIGNEIPLEELLILLVVAKAIRATFPEVQMGVQVLSCGELEALPIAIACGAFFVRSEASIFTGFRPEGETNNRGNLAKFYYLRNYLNTKKSNETAENKRFPVLWCDLQKKHTVFVEELGNLKTWLNLALFQKLEGIVLTGAETGANISESDLGEARKSIDQTMEKINNIHGGAVNYELPLVCGSGTNFEMYKKYADFIIIGTALKKNNYWENAVEESKVKEIFALLNS